MRARLVLRLRGTNRFMGGRSAYAAEEALERGEFFEVLFVSINEAIGERNGFRAAAPVHIGDARAAQLAIRKPRSLRGKEPLLRSHVSKQTEDRPCPRVDLG